MNWKPLKTDQPGVTRYQKGHSKAEINRQEDGFTQATLKEGFLGLGTHVHGTYRNPSGDDAAVLEKLLDTAHPPRFSNWEKVDGGDGNATKYEGETANGKKVTATITRDADGDAECKAQAGFFGVSVDGLYLAPAPSDQEILRRISRNPDR